MSAIIDNASTIRFQRQASIAQTKSQSGVRQAQRRGPLLYNFYVEVRPLQFGSDAYLAIEDEILDLNYSATTTSILGNGSDGTQILLGGLTTQRGSWGSTSTSVAVETGGTVANRTGNSINVVVTGSTGVANFARKGDFVQFTGYSKVYQVTADVTSVTSGSDAVATLPINGAVPGTVNINSAVLRFGQDVRFNLQLKDRPEPEFSEANIVNYSSASFEEVL